MGKKQQHAHLITFPEQRAPTTVEWKEWKSFIYRNFLNGKNKLNPVPGIIQKEALYLTEQTEIKQLQHLKPGKTLEETLKKLPPSLRQILGTISLPNDNGKDLATEITRKGAIIGASNGSLYLATPQWRNGGHLYSLQLYNTDSNHIYGYASTPTSTAMSSLTTELYGVISTVLCVYLISTQHNITKGKDHRVVIVADNKEAIQTGGCKETPMNISETLTAEHDLGQLLQELIHITSHQSKSTSNGLKDTKMKHQTDKK